MIISKPENKHKEKVEVTFLCRLRLIVLYRQVYSDIASFTLMRKSKKGHQIKGLPSQCV